MKDFVGFELEVGDTVVVIQNNYRFFKKGRIHAFTAKKVKVETSVSGSYTLRDPQDCIKVLATPDEWKLIKFTMGVEQK